MIKILINKLKILFLIVIYGLLFSSCSSVQKAFDPERKNGSDEFLIEKKSPLSMPPDFEELPLPQNKQQDDQNQSDDIEVLITNSEGDNNENKLLDNVNKELEDFISDKIKSN